MYLGISNKVAVVTAASKGIGKAVAAQLASEGCKVAICARNEETLQKTAEEIKTALGKDTLAAVCDLNKPSEIKEFMNKVESKFGGVDILVNNCGGPPAGFFEDFNDGHWDDAYQQVLMSAVRFIRLVLPGMKEKKWGRIVNITSISVKQPVDNLILSTTFRTGLTGLSKTLGTLIAKNNITINNVAPGYILTDRLESLAETKAAATGATAEAVLADMAESVPANKIGKPADIAAAVTFLVSEAAGFITGNTIHVDGGLVRSMF
jgi:3-oxoacyl-[acyl-carrier protein] reductase